MGSVSCPTMTPGQLMLEELGVKLDGSGNTISFKASGETYDGEKETWVILRGGPNSSFFGKEVIVLVLTRSSKRYGAWCKIIHESMGPASVSVPDLIWDHRPELFGSDAEEGSYANEWRRKVAAHRETWPLRLADLQPGDKINVVGFQGVWTRLEGEYKGAPLFSGPRHHRTRFSGWRSLRCRKVTA